VACVIVIATLGTWEGFWRSRGFRPVVGDNMYLWSLARTRVTEGGPSTVVLIGSSIMQVAVDLDLLSRETHGLEPVQLAMTSSSPLPVLEDLAEDPSFRGIAVCEHAGATLSLATRAAEKIARSTLDFHRRASLSLFQAMERRLRLFAQERVVFLSRWLAPDQLGRAFRDGHWPSPPRRIMGVDRAMTMVYDDAPAQVAPGVIGLLQREAAGKEPLRTDAALEANLRRIAAAVEAIHRRGGAVVFVRFACEGPFRDQSQRRISVHWDSLREQVDAVWLDLEGDAHAAGLQCSDGAHLDGDSQKRFTRILARTLNEQVLSPRR
jgi:hypothetical protein